MKIYEYLVAVIGLAVLVAIPLYLWAMNIVSLVNTVAPWGVLEMCRLIGIIVFPLGSIMGLVGLV